MATTNSTTIGIIGAGNIGAQVARLALRTGYRVVIANSRGPETLTGLVADLGDGATAGTATEAAQAGDLVVVAIPLGATPQLPAAALAGRVVVDANNYYPGRDGVIPELQDGGISSSGLLQRALPESRVVKAFNHIHAGDLTAAAAPAGTAGRRALAVFGDDPAARAVVEALIDGFGFDVVDGGSLAESRRIEPGTPGYGSRAGAEALRAQLESA